MTKQIEITRKTRSFLLENLKALTTEQFNHIPEGFNNNIIWNLGHMIAAQQGVCYIRAGITPRLGEDFINAYKSGSKPAEPVDTAGIEQIKNLLFTTLDQLEQDHNNQIFGGYTGWTTRYGVELTSIEEAINFIQFHEGLHSGCIGAIRRLV
jgi:hypothetical protein